jgi:hypothetical protein
MSTKRPRPESSEQSSDSTQASDIAPWLTSGERRPCIVEDDEPMGGDPPCWAHLFEDEEEEPPADH